MDRPDHHQHQFYMPPPLQQKQQLCVPMMDEQSFLVGRGGGGSDGGAAAGRGERKRRFTAEQIRSLESMFHAHHAKLEPREKAELARQLGLQARQVAIWFQNKRARWRSKQLEHDFAALCAKYDALHARVESLKQEKLALTAQLNELSERLREREDRPGSGGATTATATASCTFITAFVAGVEAECKLGVSVFPEHYNVGWHITSTVGSVGAAVAVGKLVGLNSTQLQQAISIASVQVTGMHESFGTDTKPFHVGRAAQNGLMAVILAQKGFSGSLKGLEAPRGWAHVVSTRENLTAGVDTLGKLWEMSLNTFKPFPCDRIIHPAIDGWIQVRKQALDQGLDIKDITNVTARTAPRVLFLTDNKTPKTGLEGKFSVYHAAAVALLDGEATPTQFTDDKVLNQTVIGLREKVSVTSDESVEEHEAFVAVEFGNGKNIELHVEHAIGSYENPLSDDFLKTKFIEQVAKMIGEERAQKAYQAFSGIANTTDVGKLARSYMS